MKRRRDRAIVFVVALGLLVQAATANADAYTAIRTDIEKAIGAGQATGVAVALTRNGRIVWQQGFGWADKAHGRRATADTPFSLASVTKPFTTTAMMTLVAKRQLSLEARANDYLGAARIRAGVGDPNKVTLRALASHSSGLPGTFELFPDGDPRRQPSMDAVIGEYGVLMTPPGERFNYSNVGLGTVAHIVALKSGVDFGEFLREKVLNPLGLAHSFFDNDAQRRVEMAARYDENGDPFPFYVTSTPGTGELYASAHDVARFAMFHLKDHLTDQQPILSDAQIDELHRPLIRTLADRSYGLGWMVGNAFDGSTVLYHNGNQPGVVTVVTLLPSRDISCAVLTNRDGDDDLLAHVRDAAIRTLVPRWTWQTLPAPIATPLPASYRGVWRGTVSDAKRAIPVVLSIGATQATVQVRGQPARSVSGLGMVEGMMQGRASGDLGLPAARAINADMISLRLTLRGSKLEGEIGAEGPIAHAKTPAHVPFLAVFSRAQMQARNRQRPPRPREG